MTYQEALTYIEETNRYGSVLGLDSIKELTNRLGNPQDSLKFVHIAGTNGKGSTLAFVSTILSCAGYRTGRYLSPVVYDYREKIQMDGKMISKADTGRYMTRIKETCDRMVLDRLPHPTAFEIETAMAFCYFSEKGCDVAVVETGMGGRLDATNILKQTLAAVITPVSMDHMAFLGDTLEEIAYQKAGIIKNNCYVIVGAQEKAVHNVIRQEADLKNAVLYFAETDKITQVRQNRGSQRFSYGEYKNLEITLMGQHQVENAALAVETTDALRKQGFEIPEEAVRQGLSEAVWPGRLSIIARRPDFLVDGAHNEAAARRLSEAMGLYYPRQSRIFIMGVLRDKETEAMLKYMAPLADHIITVTTKDEKRGLHAYDLAQTVRSFHGSVTVADSLKEAVEIAYLLAGKEGMIAAFGSLSYLGELSEIVKNRDNLKLVI